MTQRIMQLEVHYIVGGQLAVNVMHFMGDVAGTDLFLLARNAVDAFDETFANVGFRASTITPCMSEDSFISAAVARVVGATSGPKYPRIYAADQFVGEVADHCYSQQVAANIKAVTASGPDFTGRNFFPAVPESWLVTNRFSSSAETAYGTLMGYMEGIVSDDGSYQHAVYRASSQTAELVTNRMLVPNPGTIRRRLSPY